METPRGLLQNGTQYRVATHWVCPAQHSENRHIDLQEHVENPDSRACGRKTKWVARLNWGSMETPRGLLQNGTQYRVATQLGLSSPALWKSPYRPPRTCREPRFEGLWPKNLMGRQAKLGSMETPRGLLQNGTQYRVATHWVCPAQHSENRHIDLQEHVENPDSRACGRKT